LSKLLRSSELWSAFIRRSLRRRTRLLSLTRLRISILHQSTETQRQAD
jgi:hypothetical protein